MVGKIVNQATLVRFFGIAQDKQQIIAWTDVIPDTLMHCQDFVS